MTLAAELTVAAEAEWLDGWTAGPTEDQGSGLSAGAKAPDLALADHTAVITVIGPAPRRRGPVHHADLPRTPGRHSAAAFRCISAGSP